MGVVGTYDDDAEWTYELFFMRRDGIFNKVGEARHNEDADAEGDLRTIFL